jgi:hypothetical protein
LKKSRPLIKTVVCCPQRFRLRQIKLLQT